MKLHLWDVAGSQLKAKPCHHALIGQGAEGVLYVMDVTSRESLQAVDDWDQALSKVRNIDCAGRLHFAALPYHKLLIFFWFSCCFCRSLCGTRVLCIETPASPSLSVKPYRSNRFL